uniref:Tryptophan synthase beta chain-like PALP domain-containing protein n=1 Tax=Rhizochromulina marina TaxID=1034831 RepID=A0A7S2RC68_9STRA
MGREEGAGGERRVEARGGEARTGYAGLIGGTPLVELRSLSALTGRRILAKAEYLNPGGTGKDRIALAMIEEAERRGQLAPGGTVVEGTSGSTGIALAALCACRGYRCVIVMPDDQSPEKQRLLRQFGAEVLVVRTASISNPQHYVNVARKLAKGEEVAGHHLPGGGYFTDQFETLANYHAHVATTGPELWQQTQGQCHAFVMSAGTGGTIAGVSRFLKSKNPGIKVVLADPPGSSLFHFVKHGVCWAPQQSERTVRRHRYDTIAEGIGLDRLTRNIQEAEIDDAIAVSDQEALYMAHYLLKHEGLLVGSSSAINVVAAIRFAKEVPPGSTVATVLCDSGQRHLNRFWNPQYATAPPYNLSWPGPNEVEEHVGRMAAVH